MTLIRCRPRHEISPWENMDKVMRGFFNDENLPFHNQNWAPAVDISENADAITVRAEIPGISKDDIKLSVKEGTLTISGEKKYEEKEEKENYYRSERLFGSFNRSFSLPTTVDESKIKANYSEGVLTVCLPKVEEAKPKEIAIEVA